MRAARAPKAELAQREQKERGEQRPQRREEQVVVEAPAAALFAVHGTSAKDVWMVGADDGDGPLVIRFDGSAWQRLDTGVRGDLWWVRAFDDERLPRALESETPEHYGGEREE